VALQMREQGTEGNDLLARLVADPRLRLDAAGADTLLGDRLLFTGAARSQVAAVVAQVEKLLAGAPEAASYRPEPIL
jgi:adenylosuccinate lyase